MSSVLTLDVESRNPSEIKAKHVRAQGKLPGIFYQNGKENIAIQMDYQTFRKLYRKAGDSSLIELNVDGGKAKETVLVHDYQLHPVSDDFTHVDFLGVNMNEEITAQVQIEVVGVSPAVKDQGGVLSTPLNTVEVKCLPAKMPHHLEIDITSLEDFHNAIHVSDIVVPEGVEILTEGELTVATVSAPREEESEETSEASTEIAAAGEGENAEAGEGESSEG